MGLTMQPCGGGGTAYTQKNCIVDSATGTSEEIISMTTKADGSIIYYTKAASSSPGTAFVQKGYTRNSSGQLYSISGSGGMPHQINNPKPYWGTPVASADPQVFQYLEDSQPGATSWRMYWANVFPWWENVFGVRQTTPPVGVLNAEGIFTENYGFIALVVGGISYLILTRD